MFGNGFYNPYMYQPYYQTTSMARNLGGFAGVNNIARNSINAIGNSAGSELSGLGKGIFSKLSFSGFLNGASKTLNVVNQAIPIFYQVRPIINNAKTMFKIMGAVKDDNHSKKNIIHESTTNTPAPITASNNTIKKTTSNIVVKDNEYSTENPVFFI